MVFSPHILVMEDCDLWTERQRNIILKIIVIILFSLHVKTKYPCVRISSKHLQHNLLSICWEQSWSNWRWLRLRVYLGWENLVYSLNLVGIVTVTALVPLATGLVQMIEKEFQGSTLFHIHSRNISARQGSPRHLNTKATPKLNTGFLQSKDF